MTRSRPARARGSDSPKGIPASITAAYDDFDDCYLPSAAASAIVGAAVSVEEVDKNQCIYGSGNGSFLLSVANSPFALDRTTPGAVSEDGGCIVPIGTAGSQGDGVQVSSRAGVSLFLTVSANPETGASLGTAAYSRLKQGGVAILMVLAAGAGQG